MWRANPIARSLRSSVTWQEPRETVDGRTRWPMRVGGRQALASRVAKCVLVSDTSPFHQISSCISALRNASASSEEVERHLQVLDSDLDAWGGNLCAFESPSQVPPQTVALVNESLRGLELFRQAVWQVRVYMETGDEEAAELALEMGSEGLKVILAVKGFTEDAIDSLLDT